MTRSLLHHRPREVDGRILVTREAAVTFKVPTTARYIRKVCQPVACDVMSRAVLYDLDELTERFPARVA